MKAVVLAAGLGTRLRPVTDLMPKPMVPVMNEPLLGIAFRQLSLAGMGPFAVNAHYLPEQIEAYSKVLRAAGYEVNVSVELPEILGTGGAFMPLKAWIGAEPFLVYNGDLLSDINFSNLKSTHQSQSSFITMALRPGHNGKDRAVWGTENEQGLIQVHDIAKAPPEIDGIKPYTFGCAYVASPELLDFLPASGPSFVIDGMVAGLKAGLKIFGLIHQGFWSDLGTPESLFSTNMAVLAGSQIFQATVLGLSSRQIFRIHPTATIAKSAIVSSDVVVGASVIIGERAQISRAVLLSGTVIAPDEVIQNMICGPNNIRIVI